MVPLSQSLAARLDETERLAKSRGDAHQVSRAHGELLAAVALSVNAKLIIEIGTSYGFSGMWWSSALAVTGGHLHTIEVSEKKFTAAMATFAAAGLADRVTSHLGDAREILATIPGVIDVAFSDADKPSSQAYFDLVWPNIRVGGCMVTDNVLSHKEEMAAYVKGLHTRDDAHSVTIPIGGGMEWTVKLR